MKHVVNYASQASDMYLFFIKMSIEDDETSIQIVLGASVVHKEKSETDKDCTLYVIPRTTVTKDGAFRDFTMRDGIEFEIISVDSGYSSSPLFFEATNDDFEERLVEFLVSIKNINSDVIRAICQKFIPQYLI